MLRQGASPIRFAHSSGTLASDQAILAALRGAFAELPRPPVILQAARSMSGGGEGTAIWAAEAAAIAGGRSLVAAADGSADRLRRVGAEFRLTGLDGRGPVAAGRNVARLRRLIEEEGVDLIHARDGEIAWAARQAARGDVIVVTSCGVDAPFKASGALTDGDCVIAGSTFVRDSIARASTAKGERTAVVPNGVDLALYDPSAISAERMARVARNWGLLEDPAPTILMPGAIEPLRGQHSAARALVEVRADPRFADAVLIFAGEADRRSRYAERLGWIAKKGGVSPRVFMTGPLDDLPAAMMVADVVLSLPTEPLGQDPIAAMAAALGKPVVGADHGATAEVVEDGVTGQRGAPGRPEEIAARLRAILGQSAEERAAMAEASRKRAHDYFSAAKGAEATMRIYAALLSSTRR